MTLLHSSYHHPVLRDWHSASIKKTSLILPLFIHDIPGKVEIKSMPGVYRLGLDVLVDYLEPLIKKGLSCVLLFGVPTNCQKDAVGSPADDPKGPVIQAIQLLSLKFPSLLIACDVCLCEFTHHGHCGILDEQGRIVNKASIQRIAQVALNYAKAGCHMICPSDMMDNRILEIKKVLIENGFGSFVTVMSYSAKFASSFYGPFRDAACSAPSFGDRKSYQLPRGSRDLALRALQRDMDQGADILMVKPGYPYLDIVREAREMSNRPIAIYQVSGEYAMLWHGAQHDVFELKNAVLESLESAVRAGATILITYFTPQLLDWLE